MLENCNEGGTDVKADFQTIVQRGVKARSELVPGRIRNVVGGA